MKATN